jgi:cobalt-zinc-cadmium efflux system protein
MDRAASRTRRLLAVLGLNLVLVAGLAVAGVAAHSLGLLADAGHDLTDAAAVALSLWAVRLTMRPRTAERSFGMHRSTILAALLNASVIAVVTVAIALESVRRLLHPSPVHGGLVVVAAAAAFVVNGVAAVVAHEHSHDLNMRATVVHAGGDALASLAVVAAGLVIVVHPGATWADPVASLVVAGLIVVEAVRILRASVDVLMESTPADMDLSAVTGTMRAVHGVSEVHDLHVWSLSGDVRALSAHVVLSGHPTLEEAQVVGDAVKAAVARPYGIAHATVELECERCIEGDGDPCLMDALGAAGHTGEPHNPGHDHPVSAAPHTQ